jgi:hypothetical protein
VPYKDPAKKRERSRLWRLENLERERLRDRKRDGTRWRNPAYLARKRARAETRKRERFATDPEYRGQRRRYQREYSHKRRAFEIIDVLLRREQRRQDREQAAAERRVYRENLRIACAFCGEQFHPISNNQKFCSDCQAEAHRVWKRAWSHERKPWLDLTIDQKLRKIERQAAGRAKRTGLIRALREMGLWPSDYVRWPDKSFQFPDDIAREAEYKRRERAVINAFRDLGWVQNFEIVLRDV